MGLQMLLSSYLKQFGPLAKIHCRHTTNLYIYANGKNRRIFKRYAYGRQIRGDFTRVQKATRKSSKIRDRSGERMYKIRVFVSLFRYKPCKTVQTFYNSLYFVYDTCIF